LKAILYEAFQQTPSLRTVPQPSPKPHGALIRVAASGLCMSDWHGWMGHEADIRLPHVPGHEFAGVIAEVGGQVQHWKVGDRVTVPFVNACGSCPQCLSGNQQVCERQEQPGFTFWGSFAEFVNVDHADVNLVGLPEGVDFAAAASLGCRFATSFRAVVDQGRLRAGEWVSIYGCGGVGLSAIMIAAALGANVIGVDVLDEKLALAQELGAAAVVNARQTQYPGKAVRELSQGGAHLSIDALGSAETALQSIYGLRRRGRHVQVGLMRPEQRRSPIPFDVVVGRELEILGSHGMQAHRYDALLEMMRRGALHPEKLIGKRIPLEAAPAEFDPSESFRGAGITVIDKI
jgi:alcohol dehydrogenase